MPRLTLALLMLLSACATWQPAGTMHYRCINTRIEFAVTYSWDPPSAHIEETGYPPLDLAPSPPASGVSRGNYNYGGGGGLPYLLVDRNGIYFVRPGDTPLFCEDMARERIVVT